MVLLDVLRRIAGLRALLYDARLRSEVATRWAAGSALHQDATMTWLDRYPRLFTAAQQALGRDGTHRVLSFGCSSGEEVMSLRRYFPDATIVGAEINAAQLAACARLPSDPNAHFIRSTREGIAARGPYDAVFCMAVLQRRAHVVERRGLRTIARHYPFAHFAEEVRFLARQLRPGGLLVADHCQYRIEDAGAPLEPMPGTTVYTAKGPRYAPDGELIAPQPVVARLFRRAAD